MARLSGERGVFWTGLLEERGKKGKGKEKEMEMEMEREMERERERML